ncbi:hypothetical protein [Flavobacterium sp.]|uniref:hypothetical protein n=1 Tax=Flavobacterium sp. TaxID=239 RepID=UPI002630C058|nr:hypothetical protein [Flavobacterium sp.]
MAQNNIENQIREKLNAREIQPTEMAWDRLDAMLSVAEEKKTKRFPFFTVKNIGIAASILVFMSLGLFFINQKEEISNGTNTVVTKEIKNNNEQKDSVITKQNFINETVSQQEEQVAVTINNQQSTINNQQSSKSFNSIKQKTNQKSIINKEKEIEYQLTEVIAQKEMPKISFQEKVEQPKKVVNVDEVVASMEKNPKKEAISKVKVNANSLLSQVDGELEQTFRQKVISKISKNYQEVKVALANRNQEY